MHHQQAALRGPRRPLIPAGLLRLASDERLVEQVRSGSKQAFEVLFDRHHRVVLAFCRHMLGSAEEAEDAVQHTFLAAYRDLVRSDKPIALRAWLFAIARNRCLSMLRARREQPMDEAPEPSTEHLSAAVQRREDLRMLLRDLAGLPEDQRAALVLAEVGDVSHDEIAQVLGCPREKVKALVFQARSSLHASRAARETPCEEIREQLASARAGALRKTNLRRHLRECPGCRAFRAEVASQRKALALVLPVAPSLGLKRAVLGSVFGGGGSGAAAAGTGAAAAGGLVSAAPSALVAKALVVAAVAGGGAVAEVAVTHQGTAPSTVPLPAAAARAAHGSTGASHGDAGGTAPAAGAHGRAAGGVVAVTGDARPGEATRSHEDAAATPGHAGAGHRRHHRRGHGAGAGRGRGSDAAQAPSGNGGGRSNSAAGGRSRGGRAGAGHGRGGSDGGRSSARGGGSASRDGSSQSRSGGAGSAGHGSSSSNAGGSGSSARGAGPAGTRDAGSSTSVRRKPVTTPALRTVAAPAVTPTGVVPVRAQGGSSSG